MAKKYGGGVKYVWYEREINSTFTSKKILESAITLDCQSHATRNKNKLCSKTCGRELEKEQEILIEWGPGVPLHSEIETRKNIHKSKTIGTSFLLHNMISKRRGPPSLDRVTKIQGGSSPTMISESGVTPPFATGRFKNYKVGHLPL